MTEKMFKINLQLFAEGDIIDSPAPEPEKTFTQAEVDKIIQDRLAREHKKYADYEDAKGVLDELKDFGYVGDAKTVKEALKEAKQQANNAGTYKEAVEAYEGVNELPSDAVIEALAKKWGKDPKVVEKALQKQIDKDEKEEADAKAKAEADAAWNKQVEEFNEKHENVDLDKLSQDPKFMKFVKGKNLPLVELYEDYLDFLGDSEKEFVAKIQSNIDRSTSSGRQKGDALGGTYGLSADEQELAKENGMSLKDFAERKNRRSV